MSKATSSPRSRLTAEERRRSIVMAAIPVFAKKGFAGTTTRDLARAAGVSEALLYRHFPSKESLHHFIQEQMCETNSAIHDYVCELEPGARAVVQMIYLIYKIILESGNEQPLGMAIPRLMIQSLLEDGEFTRSFHEPRFNRMLQLMEAACEVAIRDGDMEPGELTHYERQWFPHHLAVALRLSNLPEQPVFNYQSTPRERLLHATRFSLRGIGLTEQAIQQHFDPPALDPVINDVLFRAGMRARAV